MFNIALEEKCFLIQIFVSFEDNMFLGYFTARIVCNIWFPVQLII